MNSFYRMKLQTFFVVYQAQTFKEISKPHWIKQNKKITDKKNSKRGELSTRYNCLIDHNTILGCIFVRSC